MRTLGWNGDAPQIDGDTECESFMAGHGWEYMAEWVPPYEDEDESREGYWTRMIVKSVPYGDGAIMWNIDVGTLVAASPSAWPLLVRLGEAELSRLCLEHGVDYSEVLV